MAAASTRILLRGGSVYSPTAPFATAMLTVDGRVAWIGEEEAADAFAADADRIVPLHGRLVTPGFVDAHAHLAQTGFALQTLDLAAARSLTEALASLEQYARRHTGSLVIAHGWDEARWPEARPFTQDELDRAVGARVTYASRVDGHSAVVSSELVRLAPEVAKASGWGSEGRVERDAHHQARTAVQHRTSAADREAAVLMALRQAASVGITSVHELNAPHIGPFNDLRLIRDLVGAGGFPDVVPYWGGFLGADAADDVVLQGLAGDLNIDGAIGSRTACMYAAYEDDSTSGHLYLDADQVRAHVVHCTRLGVQAGFHVIGDRAMSEAAAGFRSAAVEVGTGALTAARHRLEHVEMPDDAVIATLGEFGVVASVQPAFDAAWGSPGELYDRRLGWRRAGAMNPFGSLHRAGVVLAFGSDSPVTPLDPWGAVKAATAHHDETERLTVRAGFNAHTRGGHRARGVDDAGVLVPGAEATYAVWDVHGPLGVQTPDARVAAWSTDPRARVPVLPDLRADVPLPSCVETVVRGTTIFRADA